MKHRALLLAAFAAAGLLLLTACTSSEEEIAQSVRSGTDGNAGTAGSDAGGTQDGAGQDQAAGGDTAAQTQAQTESTASAESSEAVQTQAPEHVTEGVQGDAAAAEDIWSGTYVGEQETVTITLLDESSFSFSFANSGIASTAAIDGYQAVYRGDDHHVVVFEVDGDLMNITVSSEEDFDASASPLNGTYVRE